jgi:hypothetical protein
MIQRLKTYIEGPPVVSGPDGATSPHPQGPKCDACGIRGGVNKAAEVVDLSWLLLCVDFAACSGRVRADELAMMAMGGAL